MLRALYQSPALRSAVAFGLGGAAFSLGNLIMARTMSAHDYGLISLLIGLVSVAGPTAPLGTDYVLSRRGLLMFRALRQRTLGSSVAVALVTVAVAQWLYQMRPPLLASILVTTLAFGITQTVAAHYQGQRQFSHSVPYMQFSNWALLLIGAVVWAGGIETAELPSALLAACSLLTALIGWVQVRRTTHAEDQAAAPPGLWSEALPLMAINVAGSALLQLERLVIPVTIGVEELALFGVTASLVGSLYRMLQMAVTFTVIPRMRDAVGPAERRRLLRHEMALFTVVMGPASMLIWLLAPPIAHWFLAGRYDLGPALVIATIVSGLLKVLSAFGTATVSALAPDSGLRLLSMTSWACIGIATALAFAFRPWGLTGIIYATTVGWLLRTCVAFWICTPYLKSRASR
jgi:O-antigen/teichoic acid export membrane protein